MFDEVCSSIIEKNKNMMVPWYLMASYAYYISDVSILSDTFFDQLCVKLLREWNTIDHFHKHLINEDELHAGTCLRVDYPDRIINATNYLLEHSEEIIYNQSVSKPKQEERSGLLNFMEW